MAVVLHCMVPCWDFASLPDGQNFVKLAGKLECPAAHRVDLDQHGGCLHLGYSSPERIAQQPGAGQCCSRVPSRPSEPPACCGEGPHRGSQQETMPMQHERPEKVQN